MTWFKVDDNLAFHAKVVAAGNPAMGLWVRAGSWCAQHLTEGHVPDHIAATLGTKSEARRLVEVKLWTVAEGGGFQFWQWSEDGRQPTREHVETGRHAARERQRLARERAKSRRDAAVTHAAVTEVVTVPPTRPDPTRPDPTEGLRPSGGLEPSEPRKRGTRITEDWKPTPTDIEWQRAQDIDDLLARRELPKFVDFWLAKPGQPGTKLDWSATWRNWLRTAVERGPGRGRPDPMTDPAAWAR